MHLFPRIRESVGHHSNSSKNRADQDGKYARLAMRHPNCQGSDEESEITRADRVWLPRFTVKYLGNDEAQLVSLQTQRSGIKGYGQTQIG